MKFVDYASGHVNHADVAVRRAVLTGVSQVTGKISEHNAEELETDIVEVTAHAGARPDHAEWQGRWYSLSGNSKKYPSLVEVTGYGTGAGLKGWNCRHDFYPVIDGVSVPTYTEEELKNIDPPPIEYGGKTYSYYDCTQRQRRIETAMRKTKRQIISAKCSGDEDMFTAKSILLRRQKEEYEKFSKAAGLLTQNERTQVYGFGHSEASKASWAARKAEAAKAAAKAVKGGSSGSGGHAVAVDVPTPPTNGGKGKLYRDEGLTNGKNGDIIKSGGEDMLKVNTGGRRNEKTLTSRQIDEVKNYAVSLGMPAERIYYVDYDCTAYGCAFDLLRIGTDVYPSEQRQHSANSNISMRGAIAHEIVGHRNAALVGKTQSNEVLEEAQASIRAAKFTPGLTNSERITLYRDGLTRLKNSKINLKDVKQSLHIFEE